MLVVCVLLGLAAPAAHADGPGKGAPWIAGLGDSYVSGEGGRWAGNSIAGADRVDALGPQAYWDTPTGEALPGCHRSKTAEIHIGGGVSGANLACSGATTGTASGSPFKPGVDFALRGQGKVGQAFALRQFARTHNVRMVNVSIGGNDFGFGDVVERCVLDFLTSSRLRPNLCSDDPLAIDAFSAENKAAVKAKVQGALLNVQRAMRGAGYRDDQWTLLVQGYESPIPRGAGLRYPPSRSDRQVVGGCGVWDADADWANDVALPAINATVRDAAATSGIANLVQLDLSQAFNGRRLCEQGVDRVEQTVGRWDAPGAVDRSEWIKRIHVLDRPDGTYEVQESFHPDYWGQLALRNCVRQAFNNGAPRGGTCVRAGNGLTPGGEPFMALR